MSRQPPQLNRKSSAPWDRLRPVRQDPLDGVGFVSKGDTKLLDTKVQESYYHKITARYMQFCTQHSKDLNETFALLLHDGSHPALTDVTCNPQVSPAENHARPPSSASSFRQTSITRSSIPNSSRSDPADELSLLLISLRKLREGLLATAHTTASPVFSQRVHIFNIRLAVLAFQPHSYHPSLQYLLTVLHTKEHPLSSSELREMTAYRILDTALREGDLIKAYSLRYEAKTKFEFIDTNVDSILKAVVTNDWALFWRTRGRVDGYVRAIMHWYLDKIRTTTLKAIGKSYMKCDVHWILKSTTSMEMTWEELVEKESVGWLRDGDLVLIRKPKVKP